MPSVNIKHVQQQNNTLNCGVFSVLFVTLGVLGNKGNMALCSTGAYLHLCSLQYVHFGKLNHLCCNCLETSII
jgi:hypothetical protein